MKMIMVVVWLTILMFSANLCFASGFNLKSISSVSTDGRQISHWWYSGLNPVFSGEAAPGATIAADIDGQAANINADSSGNWAYQAVGELTAGDHQVSFTSDGSVIKFTLTLGAENVNWDTVGKEGSGSALPTVGGIVPTLALIVGGMTVAVVGKRFLMVR